MGERNLTEIPRGVVYREDENGAMVYMGEEIVKACGFSFDPAVHRVHYVNGDPLDNRRNNLSVVDATGTVLWP